GAAGVSRLDVLQLAGPERAGAPGLRRLAAQLQRRAASGASRQELKVGRSGAGGRERAGVGLAGDLLGTELLQVLVGDLGVEQAVAAVAQPRDQMHQRHLRGVPRPAEHALAEEGPAERDAVEPADQLLASPAFDAVGVAEVEQLAVEALDAG